MSPSSRSNPRKNSGLPLAIFIMTACRPHGFAGGFAFACASLKQARSRHGERPARKITNQPAAFVSDWRAVSWMKTGPRRSGPAGSAIRRQPPRRRCPRPSRASADPAGSGGAQPLCARAPPSWPWAGVREELRPNFFLAGFYCVSVSDEIAMAVRSKRPP